jgi:hypothetical protein
VAALFAGAEDASERDLDLAEWPIALGPQRIEVHGRHCRLPLEAVELGTLFRSRSSSFFGEAEDDK